MVSIFSKWHIFSQDEPEKPEPLSPPEPTRLDYLKDILGLTRSEVLSLEFEFDKDDQVICHSSFVLTEQEWLQILDVLKAHND